MDDEARIGAEEARKALGAVEKMRQAGVRRGLPPRWFGVMLALSIGGLVAAQTANFAAAAIVTLSWTVVILVKRQSLMLVARSMRADRSIGTVALQVGGVALILALVVGGRAAQLDYGLRWAPLAAGAGAAVVIYSLFELKRRKIQDRIEAESNHEPA